MDMTMHEILPATVSHVVGGCICFIIEMIFEHYIRSKQYDNNPKTSIIKMIGKLVLLIFITSILSLIFIWLIANVPSETFPISLKIVFSSLFAVVNIAIVLTIIAIVRVVRILKSKGLLK